MAEKRVAIEHKDGRRYSVTPATFRSKYEGQGFKITANEDGTPYVAPKPATTEKKADG